MQVSCAAIVRQVWRTTHFPHARTDLAPFMSTSMSSTNKIPEDRSSSTPTADVTPTEQPSSQETSQQSTSNPQNTDETDEPRQAKQGTGLEAVQHILALQSDHIVAMSNRLEELENTIQYIYKNTSTNAILQDRHDVRVAALRADSSRATTDNMIQRHTHTPYAKSIRRSRRSRESRPHKHGESSKWRADWMRSPTPWRP